jgi:NAD(P)-dependent dehydrogenase (short-subunit alcohol dehydrogenase family)
MGSRSKDMGFTFDLAGKVAIVTGARRGIGQSIAVALAEAGAKIVLNDIAVEELENVAHEIRERGGESRVYQADVSVKEQVEGLVEEATRVFGRIDVLVNNASILRVAPFVETREEDWDATLAVNLTGTFLCSQAATRQMIKQGGGKIINVASNAGKVPRMNNAAYCASKAGVILLTRVMALELAKFDITVNALCPGATATEMLVQVQAKGDKKVLDRIIRGDLESYRSGIPMGRLAKPEEQAAMVLYLASENANHITGQTFFVDGGQTMV